MHCREIVDFFLLNFQQLISIFDFKYISSTISEEFFLYVFFLAQILIFFSG